MGGAIRVVEIMRVGIGQYSETERVKWQGEDVDELSALYPPSKVDGVDDLWHREIDDGLIRWDCRFEQQQPDGSWIEIKDPRRRPLKVSEGFLALEAAIEEENRRLFPGDYMDEGDSPPWDDEDE